MSILRIAMLHLASRLGELGHNRQLVETAVTIAAALGAEWIITPELCLCGYQFAGRIGTAWIKPQPDAWLMHLSQMGARLHVTVFLSHPERDRDTGKCYNTVFVIGANGTWVGVHRKVNVVPGAEARASRGDAAVPIVVPPLRVGILIALMPILRRLPST